MLDNEFSFVVHYADKSAYQGTVIALNFRDALALVADYYGTDDTGTDDNIVSIGIARR